MRGFLFFIFAVMSSAYAADLEVTGAHSETERIEIYLADTPEEAQDKLEEIAEILSESEQEAEVMVLHSERYFRSQEVEKSGLLDFVFVGLRGALVATGIYLVYDVEQVGSLAALVPAILGGAMSGTAQYYFLKIKDWLDYKSEMKHPLDIKGLFRLTNQQASFVESFFLKDLLYSLLYLQLIQVAEFSTGIQGSPISFVVLTTALMALATDGSWNLSLAKFIGFMERNFPSYENAIALGGKSFKVVLSAVVSAILISQKSGAEWSQTAVYVMAGVGAVMLGSVYAPSVKSLYSKTKSFMKRLWTGKPKKRCGQILEEIGA